MACIIETRPLRCPWFIASSTYCYTRSNKNSTYVSVVCFTITLVFKSIADRKKVLKHHPDKKAGVPGHTSNDDSFFKCIQKAHEVLTNTEKRRQFDSVDPAFMLMEDDVPTAADFKNIKSAEDMSKKFFREFSQVFEREARFSRKQPVLLLGDVNDPKEKVEAFYAFWYNFDSWRSFEYLDKEVNEGSDK